MSELDAAWEVLLREARSEPGWHGRRVLTSAPCRIQAALRPGTRARGVLFEVAATSLPPVVDYPACGGFVLSPDTVAIGPGRRVRLVLEERNSAYADLFSAMAMDVTRRVAQAQTEVAAVAALLLRLQVWLRFAARFGPGHLGPEACVGLAAELLFLEQQALPCLGPAAALRAWTGPEGAAQDFRFDRCHVEVKGSIALSPTSARISNLEQLDGTAGMPLFLCHLSLATGGVGARSLPEIVADIRGTLLGCADGALEQFEERLFAAGYLDAHALHYVQPAYLLRSAQFHRVDEDFPRLTPSSVPGGVLGAAYSISLSACLPWLVEPAECTSLMRDPQPANV